MDVRDVRSVYVLEWIVDDQMGVPILVSDQRDVILAYIDDEVRRLREGHRVLRDQDEIAHEIMERHDGVDIHEFIARGRRPDGRGVSLPIRTYRVSIVEFEPAGEVETA